MISEKQRREPSPAELIDAELKDDVGRQHVVRVQGFDLPQVMVHGTTVASVRKNLRADGSYAPYGFGTVYATLEDPRSWPRSIPQGSDIKRAVVVFSTALAFLPDKGGDPDAVRIISSQHDRGEFSSALIELRRLPPGSFEVIRGDEIDFGQYPQKPPKEFRNAMQESEKRLVRKAMGDKE